ncbi:MAG: hypothetical protein HZA91_07135 [Verrucomicrobia bacterium]|nr:hypothetical protein [Verrucomicrobiota bacterium]
MITALNRRIIVILTVIVLASLAGIVAYQAWLGHPALVSDRELLDFLPPPAEIAVLHRDVETDWRKVRGSNWFRKLMARPELRRFAKKNRLDRAELSDAETWILDIIGDRVLAARVPDPERPGGYSAFAFAPIGARAKRLELWADLIQRGQKTGFKLVSTDHHGHEVVRVLVEDWPSNLAVKYTKLRGVAVIVVSETEDTLEKYLDGRITATSAESLADAIGADLGLVNWLHLGASRGRAGGVVRWVLESKAPGQLRLTTLAPLAGPPPAKVEGAAPSAMLGARLADDALLRLRGRLSEWSAVAGAYVSFFLPERRGGAQGALGRLKENAPWMGDTFAVALLPGQVMSSKLPLPVPQLAAVVECTDERQAQTGIARAVMDLNQRAKLDLDLALQATTVGKAQAQRVISHSPDLAEQIKRWPVFTFAEHTLLAGSGDDVLAAMLARGLAATASKGDENSAVWEVAPTVQVARGALAAYTLSLLFTGRPPPPEVAPWLARVEFALDVLGAVRTMTVNGRVEGEWARLVMDMSCEDLPATAGGNK